MRSRSLKADNALFSLHLKCTMMKISDPVIFGHCVAEYFADALQKHAGVLAEIGVNVNNGLADVLSKLDKPPPASKPLQLPTDPGSVVSRYTNSQPGNLVWEVP